MVNTLNTTIKQVTIKINDILAAHSTLEKSSVNSCWGDVEQEMIGKLDELGADMVNMVSNAPLDSPLEHEITTR